MAESLQAGYTGVRPMSHTLQRWSSLTFLLLGGSVFLSVLWLRNGVLAPWPAWWLQVVDLPLVGAGLLFGLTSVYRSLAIDRSSYALSFVLSLLGFSLFCVAVLLNAWPFLFPSA